MNTLEAYIDASGKGDIGITSVAGYLASTDQWAIVVDRWAGVLKSHGLYAFHGRNIPVTDRLIKDLRSVIEFGQLSAVGAALVDDHWKQSDWGEIQTERRRNPYEQCLALALEAMSRFVRDEFASSQVKIFCCPDTREKRIKQVFDEVRQEHSNLVEIFVGNSEKYKQIELADFGARQLRESWLKIGHEKSTDPWGAMPSGKGCRQSQSFWSLKPEAILFRSLALTGHLSPKES